MELKITINTERITVNEIKMLLAEIKKECGNSDTTFKIEIVTSYLSVVTGQKLNQNL